MTLTTGLVYRIVCLSNPDIQYVGSTFNQLRYRWQRHIYQYETYVLNDRKKGISLFKYFDKYGINDFKILLIKKYQVYREHNKDRKHLNVYEQLWINKLKCVNEINPFYIRKMFTKLYRNTHKSHKKAYDKERIKLKYDCECGSKNLSHKHKSEHIKTKKHKAYLESLNEV